jgi:hypothetical protein
MRQHFVYHNLQCYAEVHYPETAVLRRAMPFILYI